MILKNHDSRIWIILLYCLPICRLCLSVFLVGWGRISCSLVFTIGDLWVPDPPASASQVPAPFTVHFTSFHCVFVEILYSTLGTSISDKKLILLTQFGEGPSGLWWAGFRARSEKCKCGQSYQGRVHRGGIQPLSALFSKSFLKSRSSKKQWLGKALRGGSQVKSWESKGRSVNGAT